MRANISPPVMDFAMVWANFSVSATVVVIDLGMGSLVYAFVVVSTSIIVGCFA